MYNTNLKNLLFIDIETVPQKGSFDELNVDWQHLWEEKTQRIIPENETPASFYFQRAGVMAEFSKIVCISTGYFNNDKLRIKSFYGDDEKKLLQEFISTINQLEKANNKWSFTGHNIKEFDVPFICRRLLMNNLPIPEYLDFQNMKPWDTNLVDTFQYWRFGDYKNFTSLKLLAACLNVPSPKDDIDGSMVAEVYWKEKNLTRIVTYCQKDIVTVANIVLRFMNKEIIKEENIVFVTT